MKRALATAVLLFSAALLSAQDPAKVDPAHHKIVLENEYVRVLRITLPAGEKTALHQHPGSAVVFLNDATMRVTPANGNANTTPRKANEALLADASTHVVENVGTTPSDLIMVELKASPKAAAIKNDPVKVDSKHYKVVAENAHFRVVRATYAAGEKSVVHDHPALVAVILSDSQFNMHTMGATNEDMVPAKRGDVTFDAGVTHTPENVGKGTADVMLVELKPAT
jgi:quercetin dioxygenase-like cupin family protein